LLTAETYSKFLQADDLNVRTLFGDGAAATLVELQTVSNAPPVEPAIGPFVYGTDGHGGKNLIVPSSGLRDRDAGDVLRLQMNGPEIFSFTLAAVPQATRAVLDRAGRTLDEVDLVVFHQANAYMLEHLRDKLGIPSEKFWIGLRDCGNTVSSTVPIALKQAERAGRLRSGARVLLVGFGVGYSWGATLIRWKGLA
jgi:3-oxoacyl-[acyl-carrier-protein] synthase-3